MRTEQSAVAGPGEAAATATRPGSAAHAPQTTGPAVDGRALVELAAKVAAPTSVLTGLLFYLGWVRANAALRVYGLDASMVDYAFSDFLMRSVSAWYVPIGAIAVLGGAAALVGEHAGALGDALGRDRTARWCWHALRVAAALFAYGGIALFAPRIAADQRFVTPLALLSALWLAGVAVAVRRRVVPHLVTGRPPPAVVAAFVVLSVLAVFYATSDYAHWIGTRRARDVMAAPERLPQVSILSERRLHIAAPAVEEEAIGSDGYRFRYDGLRLLMRTRDHFVFVHDGWRPGDGTTVLVPRGDIGRIDVDPS